MPRPRIVQRVKRKRRRLNGHNVRVKNAASKRNARPHKAFYLHGAGSGLARGDIIPDGRSRLAKREKKTYNALVADLGRLPSTMQSTLFRTVARMDTLSMLASAEVTRAGIFSPGAADALVKASRELLALAESDQFTALKSDTEALKQHQADLLQSYSDEALEAMIRYDALKRGETPPDPLVPELLAEAEKYTRSYQRPADAPSKPLLLLPAPKPRPRIKRRGNASITPITEPVQGQRREAVGEKGVGHTDAAAPPSQGSQSDPFSRQAKAARAQGYAEEASDSVITRWDSPWRMR